MPSTDLESLRLVLTDDLSIYGQVPLGSFPQATGGRWGGYGPDVHDTTGFGVYDMNRTISIVDGVLDIWLHTEEGVHYVAAPWPIIPGTEGSSLWYGRIEFAFRAEPVPGYKTAWLLWPDSGRWPGDGEIDFPEGDLDGVAAISGFMHRQNAKRAGDQDVRTDGVYANNVWHTAAIVWLPDLCEFWLDGVQLGTSITERVPHTPMHWIFQTETKLDFSNPPPDESQGHVQVDWVAMWQYDPNVHVG
jgi:hypothetical protein